MSEGRGKDAWAHTSSLLALLANAHRDPKKKSTPYSSSDFNPHESHQKDKPIATVTDLSILKTVFIDSHLQK